MKPDTIYKTGKIITAKIINCSSKDYWYTGMIGKKVNIREMSWDGGFVECVENGFSILQSDVFYNGNPKN